VRLKAPLAETLRIGDFRINPGDIPLPFKVKVAAELAEVEAENIAQFGERPKLRLPYNKRCTTRRSDSKLTRGQIYELYRLYQAGLSVPTIAYRYWRELGNDSEHACRQALYVAFRNHDLPIRTFSETNIRRARVKGCSGCGCPPEERTVGCDTCRHRHYYRGVSIRGGSLSSPQKHDLRAAGRCVGCGMSREQETPGCRTCRSRMWQRKAKVPANVA
jgi:hypothetical protein